MKPNAKTIGVAVGGAVVTGLTYLAGHTGCWADLIPPGTEVVVSAIFAIILAQMKPLAQKETFGPPAE